MAATQFCFGTLAGQCFNHNFRFKLGAEVSAFSWGLPSDTPFNEVVSISQSWLRQWSKFPMAVQRYFFMVPLFLLPPSCMRLNVGTIFSVITSDADCLACQTGCRTRTLTRVCIFEGVIPHAVASILASIGV